MGSFSSPQFPGLGLHERDKNLVGSPGFARFQIKIGHIILTVEAEG